MRRLREGKTISKIIEYIIQGHPHGLKRSEVQERLKGEFGVGESTGGVNRQLKRLREAALIEWDQESYTQKLPADWDSKDFFMRVVDAYNMSTDHAYFLSLRLRRIVSEKTATEIDDYLGGRYDHEMNENTAMLQNDCSQDEMAVHEAIARLTARHNSYVRLRLYKTANESFIRDISHHLSGLEAEKLAGQYARNLATIEASIRREMEAIFKAREDLIRRLADKRLKRKMKYLIRFALKNARPSHVYDGLL